MCTLQGKKEKIERKFEKARDFILWQMYKLINLL